MMAYPAHVQVTNVQSNAGPDPRLLVNAEQDGFKVLPETRCVLLSDEGGQRDGDQRGAAGVSLLECKSLCAEDDWGCKPCRVFSWCKGGSDGCGTCDRCAWLCACASLCALVLALAASSLYGMNCVHRRQITLPCGANTRAQ